MAERKKGFNKDGSVDKRYKKNKGDIKSVSLEVKQEVLEQDDGKSASNVSYIQDIIDSRQAPGVHISAENQSAPSAEATEERRMAIYKENTNGLDPNEPICHDKRTQTGGDWDIQGTRRNL